ncbi:hypothetical protein niasHT_015840 [Heterodera trifolii]|uniref:Uncharacterized protein n=1 Tax=Heterodera trifolii TaxID=157864 RepID=A0ABD2L4T9_9BILA
MKPIGYAFPWSSSFHLYSNGRGSSLSKCFAVKLPFGALILCLLSVSFCDGLKCSDCSTRDCMGCEGDYCLMSYYAPRWGTSVWGEPTLVKGCLSGTMLRRGVKSHCETADAEGKEPFTCFCDGKDYCNKRPPRKAEMEPIQLFTCICEGTHCREKKTCTGELCTFVTNHRSKERERGCVNSSVPLVERRSAGACMMPPITGAMHHTVAKRAEDLLRTESCVCQGDFCNAEKPKPVPENSRCTAFAQFELLGQKMKSKKTSCTGEFCFRADIKSKLGHLNAYQTIGCASFSRDSKLAEELEPTGCAKFNSEDLQVEVCFTTNDSEAIERAKESRQNGERKAGKIRPKNGREKVKGKGTREKEEREKTMEEEETEEEEAKDKGHKGVREQGEDGGSRRRELQEDEEGEEETAEKEETEQEEEAQEETENGRGDSETKQQQQHVIFERPTLAPAVTESNNTALIFVFLLLILLILLSGAVWKLQLHKKLFRASYDTVAGG